MHDAWSWQDGLLYQGFPGVLSVFINARFGANSSRYLLEIALCSLHLLYRSFTLSSSRNLGVPDYFFALQLIEIGNCLNLAWRCFFAPSGALADESFGAPKSCQSVYCSNCSCSFHFDNLRMHHA